MISASECTPVPAPAKLDLSMLENRMRLIIKASAFMDPASWAAERTVSQTKWFDYRFLSPVEATLMFIDSYQQVFRWKWATAFDRGEAEKKRGMAAGGLFHDRKEFSDFWGARVHADLLGVDYRIYIATCMDAVLRRAKQKRLPRPGQLRSDDCIQAVLKRWDDEFAGGQWMSDRPHYRTENFHELPDQLAHQEHVAIVVRKRSNPLFALGAAIDKWRVLPALTAEQAFDPETIARARETAAGIGSSAPVELLAAEDLIPSCFGLPALLSEDEGFCGRCPLIAQCQQSTQIALDRVGAEHGSEDPHLEHRRTLTRERVRRHRERQRAARAGTAGPPAETVDVAA